MGDREALRPPAAGPSTTYKAEIDFLAGILIGVALVSEGSLSLIAHERILAGCFKILGAIMLSLTTVFFIWRTYSRRPRAGETFYLSALGVFFFVLIGFVIWSAVASFSHYAA